ncbi:MAG: PilZ domain-containing protein [Desulfobacter sp.]|nr:MAG: PilZ domain-containing protein [Desulfobacter sp.]
MTIKIFANAEGITTISCPECGKSYQKNVSRFLGHKSEVRLKYTCKCRHQFSLLLERRRSIRKPVLLRGNLIDKSNENVPITITDISKHGLRINFTRKTLYELDNIVHIEFILDDPNHSSVTTKVRIKRFLSPLCAGCEFLSSEHYDNLGKYFLFHF